MFGIIISCFILNSVIRRDSSGLYQALAREKDYPNKTLYIVIPYFATLSGGILINYYFPNYVVLGYLICGIADASGEVIGTKFGKHQFKVKVFNIHNSFKSIEGSSSIFLISFIIYAVFTYNIFQNLSSIILFHIFLSSLIITIAEIITPKGLDNLSIQLLAVIAYQIIIQ